MIKYYLYIIFLLVTAFTNSCYGQVTRNSTEQKIFQELQRSHIDANIPDSSQFNTLLKRDIEQYFSSKYGKVTVKWDFLREGPTQSGVSYPKFYLWTKINKEGKLISEGAVRIAAIERKNFDVTDYVTLEKIKSKSVDIYYIFPKSVCEKIINRVNKE